MNSVELEPAATPNPGEGIRAEGEYRVVIDSKRRFSAFLEEAVARRELLYFLVWRDIKVRYKQTALGVLWALLLPLVQTFLFTLVFGRFAKINTGGNYSYPVFVLAGVVPWTLFSQALTLGSQSLTNQQHLMTKVYFPRIYVPMAAVGGCLIDFVIGLLLYSAVLAYYHQIPPIGITALPLLIGMTLVAALGPVFLFSALTVAYRDFKYVIPVAVQLLMYASPVVYPASLISGKYSLFLAVNPMMGIIDGYRSAILGNPWNMGLLVEGAISSTIFLVVGILYFRSTERRFADVA